MAGPVGGGELLHDQEVAGPVGGVAVARRRTAWWVRLVLPLLGLGIGAYVLAGSWGQLAQAADAITRVQPSWVLAGAVAEVVSYLCIGAGLRLLLGGRPGLVSATTIAVTAQAAANCLPGGAAVSGVVTYRQLRRRGAAAAAATGAVLLLSALQTAALPILALTGSELSRGEEPIPGLRALSTGLLAVLILLAGVLFALRRRHLPSRALAASIAVAVRLRSRLPFLRHRGDSPVEAGLQQLRGIRTDGQALALAGGLSLAYWLTDALCLAAAFPAVGAAVPWAGLLVGYSAAQLASLLPFTPGGLGVVEGSLTVALVAYGGSTASALTAVLLYRLLSFWAVLLAGGVGGLVLWRAAPAGGRP